jgi:riboflavin-specific deaminase-like protein
MIENTDGQHDFAGTEWAWRVVLSARELISSGSAPAAQARFTPDARGTLQPGRSEPGPCTFFWHPKTGWELGTGCAEPARGLLELYLPLCGVRSSETHTVGHLGQSLDGCIATRTGDSCYVTGGENIRHLHRMRALSDAIIVGAETIAEDNPRLTTRLVEGKNPTRVVLDPRRRLHSGYAVFEDGAAPTLLICNKERVRGAHERHGDAEVLGVASSGGRLDLDAVLRRLRERGLFLSFVEGGGLTVSAFAQARLLDRLQIAVAPMVIGNGRPGLQLPPAESMGDCLRPRHRIFRMGGDILFDCEPAFDPEQPQDSPPPTGVTRLI